MTSVKLLLGDRKRRQRGSVLSAVLIIVLFLSILVGALMTELTTSFLASRVAVTRVAHEATVTSAVELSISQLQNRSVPPNCARDTISASFVSLNGYPASVMATSCGAIVPDLTAKLAPGAFAVDGIHDTTAGRDRYIVGDSSGVVSSYPFGQTAANWSISIGGPLTAPPLTKSDPNGDVDLLIPTATSGGQCAGHCVALFADGGGTPSFRCTLAASARTTTPAVEVTAGGSPNFPGYVFFGDAGGHLYAYDATAGGGCKQLATSSLGGAVVGAPLVFPGTVTRHDQEQTTTDEIFVLTTGGGSTVLHEYLYSETDNAEAPPSLNEVDSQDLAVGGNAIGYDTSSNVPAIGSTISLVVAGSTGRLAIGRIRISSTKGGASYSPSAGPSTTLPGAISHSPFWCSCPGQDLIGVGSTNGTLYVLNTGLSAIKWTYDGQADGRPAINTTPAADSNGDWYFGADDGFTYDVEIRASGTQMFKAARFGPGGAIRSSPIVGTGADGCAPGPCMYFASSSSGAYFAQIGFTRIFDLRACVVSAPGSTSCAANPRLWARLEVGSPAVVGARGVYVQGWSYYSP